MRSRFWILALVALLYGGALKADIIPVPHNSDSKITNEPVPTEFTLSTVKVPADPRFTNKDFNSKWPHISLEEAKKLHDEPGTVFVDGRSYMEWEQSHVSGAVPLPIGEFDKRYLQYKSKLLKAKVLVSYCHGEGCRLSDHLAQLLTDKGHKNVVVFWGGFPAWHDANFPLVDKSGKKVGNNVTPVNNSPGSGPGDGAGPGPTSAQSRKAVQLKKRPMTKAETARMNPGSGPGAGAGPAPTAVK